jgi:phosphate transport system permease protein
VEAGQPAFSLRAQGRSRRRLLVNRGAEGVATLAAFGAVAVLGVVVVSVLAHGIPALNLDFFTKNQVTFGESGGGVANALVGTVIMVVLATAMALPVGILVAIYVAELAPRAAARSVRLALDVLNGVPSVVIGIFVYALLVLGSGYAGWKGSFALAIVMLPLVSRSTMEVLDLVPGSLREASYALGVSKWRTVLFVVMPTVLGGILTGATLAVARAAGETAPLLFTTSVFLPGKIVWDPRQAMASLPLIIFFDSEAPEQHLNDTAWAAGFVLMAFVLASSLTARFLLNRSARTLEER